MKYKSFLAVIIVAGSVLAPSATPRTLSQSDVQSCSAMVRMALSATDELCDGTGRNEACYGNLLVEAQPQADVVDFTFGQRGDIVDVADLQSLRTSPMDLQKGEWGVALMRLQATVSDLDPAHNLTLILMGDAKLDAAGAASANARLEAVVNTNGLRANVRQTPEPGARVIGKLNVGDTVAVTGRNANGSWLRVELADGTPGWVFARLLRGQGFDQLEVVTSSPAPAGPMHAFYFTSGVNDSSCPEAPESGLLIQTAEGVAEVTLMINEVDIQLGSTVFFQAQPGADMSVYVVEGHAQVTAFGMSEYVPAGATAHVPLDDEGHAAGPPTDAVPYSLLDVAALPLELLDRPIEIAPPTDDGDDEAGVPVDEEEGGDVEDASTDGEEDTLKDKEKDKEPKDKTRPGDPQPPADPQPPGDPSPPGNPPPLDDSIDGTKDKTKDDKVKKKDVSVFQFMI